MARDDHLEADVPGYLACALGGYGVNATPGGQRLGWTGGAGLQDHTHGHSIVLDVLAWFGIPWACC